MPAENTRAAGLVVDVSIALAWPLPDEAGPYLELAKRRRLPLASDDGDLCDAARAEGVQLI